MNAINYFPKDNSPELFVDRENARLEAEAIAREGAQELKLSDTEIVDAYHEGELDHAYDAYKNDADYLALRDELKAFDIALAASNKQGVHYKDLNNDDKLRVDLCFTAKIHLYNYVKRYGSSLDFDRMSTCEYRSASAFIKYAKAKTGTITQYDKKTLWITFCCFGILTAIVGGVGYGLYALIGAIS